ncbi:hypothetical protein BJ912DRAFT_1056063 [Pholiota molesta]|nr:hypothetical protein BJ912DRAFT_1056063 [Pholiota molesta]
MSDYLGTSLKDNMKAGRPTRTKSAGDYIGQPMSACGDFAKSSSRSSMQSPWLLPASGSACSLHDEITKFMSYMEPTASEKAMRQDLVRRFTNLIASFGMDATVRPVGSYVTDLYLPTSDIDMVLTVPGHTYSFLSGSDLRRVLNKIQCSGFASEVKSVLHATVPLIRIKDKVTGIEIDLTAADTHGIKATEAVQKWMQNDMEIIKMLVTVVKMFLLIRRCGTTYTGGVNSYVLVWMVVAWVHLEWNTKTNTASTSTTTGRVHTSETTIGAPMKETTPPVDFGRVLEEFLDFYGNKFDYYERAIEIEPRPSYRTKIYSYSQYPITQSYSLSIFDPADRTIDMGAKAYGIKHVQASFRRAHKLLVERQSSDRAAKSKGSRSSILGEILGGDFTNFEARRKKLGYDKPQ